MDRILMGMSTTDKIGSRELVHSRERLRNLLMVSSSSSNGYSYGDYCGSKAQEALCVTNKSEPAVYDTLVEKGVKKIFQPHVYHTHRVVCLA